ncbi:uncharacterized protein BDW43DRAFT_313631 [Aspergillus alliaceus]|uniref:uncharacterized protein n=1 Tax=Petromyces alliaceus TaxID=209559 RepID=UPI0012A5CE4C|nr:uncharacterized protein BDW43DRAFT_313631 [Aspergillus alliaceus]KAB8230823.1 hypothetical protein BDW43DRAFT_313631 [Aspergillus alliaceus]
MGVPTDEEHLRKARSYYLRSGGAVYLPCWAKFWLALLGLYDWEGIDPYPVEMWLLPEWFPSSQTGAFQTYFTVSEEVDECGTLPAAVQERERAHRRAQRNFLEWCNICCEWFSTEDDWQKHCRFHLDHLQPRCGLLTSRHTLVYPGLYPYCLGDSEKQPPERFKQWRVKSTLINHINEMHLSGKEEDEPLQCPRPCCEKRSYCGTLDLRRHFFNAHSIEEPRRNCVSQKRKWIADIDVGGKPPKRVC